jgi:hypothetical protein
MQYTESQKFGKWVLWVVLPVTVAFTCFSAIYSYKSGQGSSFGYEFSFSIIPVAVMILFFVLRLDTTINDEGIFFRFYPFQKGKFIPWTAIDKAYVRKYNPISEYGGWGLRTGWSKKTGGAYNTAGDMGLQLEYKDGKRFLLGTQRADELRAFMEGLYKSGVVLPL